MALRPFNSMGRKVEGFAPRDPDHARVYVCGPNAYTVEKKHKTQ